MRKADNKKLHLKFNIAILDNIIITLLSNISHKKFVGNVHDLFEKYAPESYITQRDKEIRVNLIKRICTTIKKSNITTKEELLSIIDISGLKYEETNAILINLSGDDRKLNTEQQKMVDQLIAKHLQYSLVEMNLNVIMPIAERIITQTYDDYDEEYETLSKVLLQSRKDLDSAKEVLNDSKYNIDLNDESLDGVLNELIDDALNPGYKIKTAIKALNVLLNGGFEPGRTYGFFGLAKGWKSAMLLNCAIWAKTYNNIKPKDPTKRPAILYVSMENTSKETLSRILCYAFGNDLDLTKYKTKDVKNALEEARIITPDDPNSPTIKIVFKPNKSISTDGLYDIIDDFENEGYETSILIFDYIMRIRSALSKNDTKLHTEYGDIVNELSMLAKIKNIPVITASQMNREAFRLVESASNFQEQIASAGKLGVSHFGESINIAQNLDVAIILSRHINPNYNEAGEFQYVDKVLSVVQVLSRNKSADINKFLIRFKENNDLRVQEDEGTPLDNSIQMIDSHNMAIDATGNGSRYMNHNMDSNGAKSNSNKQVRRFSS